MSTAIAGRESAPPPTIDPLRVADAFRASADDLDRRSEAIYAAVANEQFRGRGGHLAASPEWGDFHIKIVHFRWMNASHYARLVGETMPPCPPTARDMTAFMNNCLEVANAMRAVAERIETGTGREGESAEVPRLAIEAPRADGPQPDGRTICYKGESVTVDPTPFMFAKFMWDRESASYEEIASAMNPDGGTDYTNQAYKTWANRFKQIAAALNLPWHYTTNTKVVAGRGTVTRSRRGEVSE